MNDNFLEYLLPEQKKKLLENRIQQFATEAYQHYLNVQTAEALGADEQAEKAKESIKILEAAIAVHKEQLDKIQG